MFILFWRHRSRCFRCQCSVREAEWIEGWSPLLVGSEPDVAEPDCVFFAPAEPHDALWYIVRHELKAGEIEMLKVPLRSQLAGFASG